MRRLFRLAFVLPLAIALVVALLRPTDALAGGSNAPIVTITSPTTGANFLPGQMVQFSGTAFDPESGNLTGVFLFWSSNIQGPLGSGNSFSRNDLISGRHVVTLMATSPTGGPQGSGSVTFTVGVPTATPTRTNTSTATPTRTDTPVPPTATLTPTPVPATATFTPTSTAVPPTSTQTPAFTATRTAAPTATRTLAPETRTATRTASPPTATVTRTRTPEVTATKTATRTPTATPTPRPHICADVDFDGRVTWRDVHKVWLAILTGVYVQRYDINQNGRLGWWDLRAAVAQLGRECHQQPPNGSPTPTKTAAPPTATKTVGSPTVTKTPAPPTATKTPEAPPTETPTPSID